MIRRLVALSAALTVAIVSSGPPRSAASAGSQQVQSLFLGDRTCGDDPYDCAFSGVSAMHRYLHVVLHDAEGASGWQVLVGDSCSEGLTPVAGNLPVPATTFLELS